MQRAGPPSVLSGGGRDNTGLAAILSLPIGVGRCEAKRIGYTCRRDVPTIFGQGFNSPRLHQIEGLGYFPGPVFLPEIPA